MKFHRHAALNDIVQRSLASADIPSTLEPSGLSRSDGKRPDGLTFVPWERGRPLLWDATVPDTMAQSYRSTAVTGGGCVARLAESKKVTKYAHLLRSYIFTPLAVESMGAFGPLSLSFIHSLGRLISRSSNEPSATTYLFQRISTTIQRGNASLICDTLPPVSSLLF
jgi:hypothetical protein